MDNYNYSNLEEYLQMMNYELSDYQERTKQDYTNIPSQHYFDWIFENDEILSKYYLLAKNVTLPTKEETEKARHETQNKYMETMYVIYQLKD